MKIDVYCTMRNEIKMLPYFLRYYETMADRIFVFDDDSTDGSREMLQAHPRVTLLDPGKHGIDDHHWVRGMFPIYQKLSRDSEEWSDWAIFVDADEFVVYNGPDITAGIRLTLWDALALIKKTGGYDAVRCPVYSMMSESFPTTDRQIFEEVNVAATGTDGFKDAVISPDVYVRWNMGRHGAVRIRGGRGKNGKGRVYEKPGFMMLHMRFLGWEYTEARYRYNCERRGQQYDPEAIVKVPGGKTRVAKAWFDEQMKQRIRVI